METETSTRTLKIRVTLLGDDLKAVKEQWGRFDNLVYQTFKAANWCTGGQYLNDQLLLRLQQRAGVKDAAGRSQNKEVAKKIRDSMFGPGSVFEVLPKSVGEWDIKAAFPDLPPSVTNVLARVVDQNYRNDYVGVLKGERSLRTYKRNMSVPVMNLKVEQAGKDFNLVWRLPGYAEFQFTAVLGQDRGNYSATLKKIISGEVVCSNPCTVKRDTRTGKVYMNVGVIEPKKVADLDPTLCLGVDVGIRHPAYVGLSRGPARAAVGTREGLIHGRLQHQHRRRALQKVGQVSRSGHGRKRKFAALDRQADKEQRWARTFNDNLSRQIVDFAIRHRAGVLKMEDLRGVAEGEKKEWMLRNWGYFQLQTMIEQKADRVGIRVVKIDPAYTSQTCSECGNLESGQRDTVKQVFICKKCGVILDPDHNAAVNIARSEKIVGA